MLYSIYIYTYIQTHIAPAVPEWRRGRQPGGGTDIWSSRLCVPPQEKSCSRQRPTTGGFGVIIQYIHIYRDRDRYRIAAHDQPDILMHI